MIFKKNVELLGKLITQYSEIILQELSVKNRININVVLKSILDKLENKKNQHFIWRYYLRPWMYEKSIVCLRRSQKKVFSSNPEGRGCGEYFYKNKQLNSEEINFIKDLVIKQNIIPILKAHTLNLIQTINSVFDLQKIFYKYEADEFLISKYRAHIENHIFDNIHTDVENNGKQCLEFIRNKKIDFFNEEENRFNFLNFICTQYFRTSKIKKSIQKNKYFETTWNTLSIIFSINSAYTICKDSYNLHLIENMSSLPFITGDQPVINTYYDRSKELSDDELEFYYPISPKLSILITKNKDLPSHIIADANIVSKYNNYIVENSVEEIYADQNEILNFYSNKFCSDP